MRTIAYSVLLRIHPMNEPMRHAMLHLTNSDTRVRTQSLQTLQLNPAATLDFLIEALRTDPGVRWRALCALQHAGDGLAVALPVVVPCLRDSNRLVRREAVELIVKMGLEAKAAIPELIRAMNDDDEAVRDKALLALDTIGLGPNDSAAIPALRAILHRQFHEVNRAEQRIVKSAAGLLGSMGASAAPALVELLRAAILSPKYREGYDVYEHDLDPVIAALAQLGTQAEPAVSELLGLLRLKETPEDFRARIATTLGQMPADLGRVVKELAELCIIGLQARVRDAVEFAFYTLGATAVPFLISMVEDNQPTPGDSHHDDRRCFAAWKLGDFCEPEYPARESETFSQASKASIPSLMAAFKEGSPALRAATAHALGKMGRDASIATPLLSGALQDADPLVRIAVAGALQIITNGSE